MCAKQTDTSTIDLDMLRQEFEKLRAGLGDMTDRLGDGTQATLNQISDYLRGDSMSARLSSVEAQLSNLGTRLKESGKDAVDRLETEVVDKPFVALAVAFGVGLLAASLLRRG